jgi:hypothetical protein
MKERHVAKFLKHKVNENGSAEFRQEGSTTTFRCGAGMFDGPAPDSIEITAPNLAAPDSKRLEALKAKEEKAAAKAKALADKQAKADAKAAAKANKTTDAPATT